jgi:hypothetical protein
MPASKTNLGRIRGLNLKQYQMNSRDRIPAFQNLFSARKYKYKNK